VTLRGEDLPVVGAEGVKPCGPQLSWTEWESLKDAEARCAELEKEVEEISASYSGYSSLAETRISELEGTLERVRAALNARKSFASMVRDARVAIGPAPATTAPRPTLEQNMAKLGLHHVGESREVLARRLDEQQLAALGPAPAQSGAHAMRSAAVRKSLDGIYARLAWLEGLHWRETRAEALGEAVEADPEEGRPCSCSEALELRRSLAEAHELARQLCLLTGGP
jgi:hypothetical protein